MKKIILMGIMILFVNIIFAQNKAEQTKERAKQKAENRLDNKIDQGIDSALDSVEGLFKRKKKKKKKKDTEAIESNDNEGGLNLSGMFGGSKAEYKETYDFTGHFTMETTIVENVKKDKKETISMQYYIADENYVGFVPKSGMGDNTSATFSIMDFDNNAMVTLIEDSKMGTAMYIDFSNVAEEESTEEVNPDDYTFKKTGRHKQILGHRCAEYTMTKDGDHTEMWVATDLDFSLARAFGNSPMLQQKGAQIPDNMPTGFLMEMTTTYNNEKEKMIMKVTELELNSASSKSTQGYQMLGGF